MTFDFYATRSHRVPNGRFRLLADSGNYTFVLFLLVLLFGTVEKTVSGQDADLSPDDVLRVRTDLVTVPVAVTDARGQRQPGLNQSDFSLKDNARAVTITYFAAGTERV